MASRANRDHRIVIPEPAGAVTRVVGREVGVHVGDPRLHELRRAGCPSRTAVERLRHADEDVRVRRRRHLGDERVPQVLEPLVVERAELVARGGDKRVVRAREDVEVAGRRTTAVVTERVTIAAR